MLSAFVSLASPLTGRGVVSVLIDGWMGGCRYVQWLLLAIVLLVAWVACLPLAALFFLVRKRASIAAGDNLGQVNPIFEFPVGI